MSLDYSKWNHIEVSDDEDETHPNIDTPSLFKWRHEARIKRMEEFEEEKRQVADELKLVQNQKNEIKKQIDDNKNDDNSRKDELEKKLYEIEQKEKKVLEKQNELIEREKKQPWNVDTISKESWSKTLINKPKPKQQKELSDEERQQQYIRFIDQYEKDIKAYGMLSKWDDCKRYLLEKPDLCCEVGRNCLAIWCLNLEIEGKSDLMKHIAKQVISLQYILELAKQLDRDPRSCISQFFTKIQKADKEYFDAFYDELEEFKQRIQERAKVKIQEAMKEVEEEERKARLGPGGLDPLEVIETLPPDLRECFDNGDTEKLKQVLASMDEESANYHMKRCVDSGLWVLPADDKSDNNESEYGEIKEQQQKKEEGEGEDEATNTN